MSRATHRLIAVAIVAMAIALTTPVLAQGTSPAVGYVFLSGSSLVDRGESSQFTTSGTDGCTYLQAGTGGMTANLQIPSGALITGLDVYFYDANAGAYMLGELLEYHGDGTGELITSATSTGSSGYQVIHQDTSFVYEASGGALAVVASFTATGNTLKLCGFRVRYLAPGVVFADDFEHGNTGQWSAVTP